MINHTFWESFVTLLSEILLIIRQKGKSQNGCFKKKKKNKARQIFQKKHHFLTPDMHIYVCVSWGKKCSFFGKFGKLCFLETPILRYALLPYYQQYTDAFE